MLKRIKKAIPAVISAILCITMVLGATASAQSVKSCRNECAKLANSSFDQNYVDFVIKYYNKEAKNTIAFGKSRAKKFLKKLNSQVNSAKSEFSFEMSDKNFLYCVAQKGDKIKMIECDEIRYEYDGIAVFTDGKSFTALSVADRTKTKVPDNVDKYYMDYMTVDTADISKIIELPDDMTGKYFKFKSGEKIYYYEEFTIENIRENDAVGFLFDEKGNILAMVSDEEAYCVSFKTKVDDSEFDIPKGYKTVDFDDFDF